MTAAVQQASEEGEGGLQWPAGHVVSTQLVLTQAGFPCKSNPWCNINSTVAASDVKVSCAVTPKFSVLKHWSKMAQSHVLIIR